MGIIHDGTLQADYRNGYYTEIIRINNCDSIQRIELPNGIDVLRQSTIHRCRSLREIIFGTGLSTIEHDALCECNSLKHIILPNGLFDLDYSNQLSFTTINLPESLRNVSLGDSNSLLAINIEEGWVAPHLWLTESRSLSLSALDKFANRLGMASSPTMLYFSQEVVNKMWGETITTLTLKNYTVIGW